MYTTQDYINSLYKDRANIVKNLNEKGVEASADETFTQLAPKILNISAGGGEGIYLKNTVEEMEGISSPSENDICLVYSKIQQHPEETSSFTKVIIRHEVSFEEAVTSGGMMEFGTSDFNSRLSVSVGTNYASIMYDNMSTQEYQHYSYQTTDGKTFILQDYAEDIELEFDTPMQNMMEYNATCSEFLWIDKIDFAGLYQYLENAWNYLDIDIKTAADQIFSPNKAYTSEGIVEGTTDPKTMYKIPIYIQADEPTDKNGIWIKPSYDYTSIARGKKVIMFTNEDVGPKSNKAVQISTLSDSIGGYVNEGNTAGSGGIFGHIYYRFSKIAEESYSIDLLTGEKTSIPVCSFLQGSGERSVRQICLDKLNNDMYLLMKYVSGTRTLETRLYRYDINEQTYEDKTSFLGLNEPGNSVNLSWIHDNQIRMNIQIGGNIATGYQYAYKIFDLNDWSLIQSADTGSNYQYFGAFYWSGENQVTFSDGTVWDAYTGETITEGVENPVQGSIWIPKLSKWSYSDGWGGCLQLVGDDYESAIKLALNFYSNNGNVLIGDLPTVLAPLEDKILFRSFNMPNVIYAIAYDDIKPVPTLNFNDNEVITLQIAPTSFQEPYNWSDKGLDALALNIKNAFLYNDNYYNGTPGTNAAKYVYLGDGTNWNLIASNIYTEEA